MVPRIQLKPEHIHQKNKKIISFNPNHINNVKENINQQDNQINYNIQQQQQVHTNNTINQQNIINTNNISPNINSNINSKQIVKQQQHSNINQSPQHNTKQSKQPIIQNKQKLQKTLNVQIIKHQSDQPKLLQPSQQQQDKKSKKKKNKRKLLPIQDISPQKKLQIKTHSIYTQFIQKNNIKYNSYHPQMMTLLKQSFIPFAQDQIKEQRLMMQKGQDVNNNFNRAQIYNQALMGQLLQRKRFHEDRIYYGVLQQNQLFNDLIWRIQVHSQPKKQQVSSLFNNIHMLVINDVWDGQYEIHQKQKPSKDQIIYGSYKANQIKLAQSIIKQKLSNLNQQFTIDNHTQQDNNDQLQTNKLSLNQYKKYDLNSQQTKKAQQFIKKLKQQQKLSKQRQKQHKLQQEQQLITKLQQQQQQQRRLHQTKIQQRRIKLIQKAQQRQRQKKYRQQQQKQYQQYLTQHRQKTPLFKKKQQDFKAFLIKQHMKKLQLMKQIQHSKRSVSKDQIEIHQIKYKQLKQLLQEERAQMVKLQQQQIQQFKKTFYKGKFHQSLMTQIHSQTLSEQKKNQAQQLYTKKIQYATIVKNNFVPKIDLKKKQQLQKLIKDLAPKPKDDKEIAQKTKLQGISNLQKLHLFMAEMKAKGKIKKSSTPLISQIQNKKSRYVNYLDEIKSSRMMNSQSMRRSRFTSLDTSKLNRNSLGIIQLQAKNLQQSADRKSLFLKNTKHLDMEDYLSKKFQLEENYIESAKAKMKVLSKYQMED